MRLRGSTRAAAFAVAVAGFVGSMTGIAWAPKNLSTHVIEADCQTGSGSGDFMGSITLTGFSVVNGQLVGLATVDGRCTLVTGQILVRGDRVAIPVTIAELSCHELELVLGDFSVGGTTVRAAGTQLFLSPGTRAAQARYCAAERLAATFSVAEMTSPLSHLLFQ
ncbi:MAG TPA: hypothetical protein VHI71_00565 [Actinomycetota bacterium]|nr:hypothetical protein [Actinomycetota bacterium]